MTAREPAPGIAANGATPDRVPPHDLRAEASLLGAMLLSADAIVTGKAACHADDFYQSSHGHIFSAIVSLSERGDGTDWLTVTNELGRSGHKDAIGDDPSVLVTLQANTPSITNAADYARIVADKARYRRMIGAGAELAQAGYSEAQLDTERLLAEVVPPPRDRSDRFIDGAEFVRAEAVVEPIWGDGEDVLWSKGEACMLCGPTGVGKTTIAQELLLYRMGLRDGPLLGLSVAPDPEADRPVPGDGPTRAGGAVTASHGDRSRRRRAADDGSWCGRDRPSATSPGTRTTCWPWLADRAGIVVVDSLKDAAIKLPDDEVGALWNRAVQTCLAEGSRCWSSTTNGRANKDTKPKGIEDVYGSTWITAGAGSVILLWGSAGDATIELVHLKPPVATVGPLKIEHDHRTGTSTVSDGFNLLAALRATARGLTATDAARQRFGVDQPDDGQRAEGQAGAGRHGREVESPIDRKAERVARVALRLPATTP